MVNSLIGRLEKAIPYLPPEARGALDVLYRTKAALLRTIRAYLMGLKNGKKKPGGEVAKETAKQVGKSALDAGSPWGGIAMAEAAGPAYQMMLNQWYWTRVEMLINIGRNEVDPYTYDHIKGELRFLYQKVMTPTGELNYGLFWWTYLHGGFPPIWEENDVLFRNQPGYLAPNRQ